jgi:hypothetical protein
VYTDTLTVVVVVVLSALVSLRLCRGVWRRVVVCAEEDVGAVVSAAGVELGPVSCEAVVAGVVDVGVVVLSQA